MGVQTAVETATETQVDQSQAETQTETTETEETQESAVEERAAETQSEDAASVAQVEVVEEKPDYLTRAEWEKEKAGVAERAAADALEADRRRRQTEGARKAQQEKRDKELHDEALDIARATFAAELGVTPSAIPDDLIDKAISRVARRQAESLAGNALDAVEQAWDYLTAPAYGKQTELDEAAEPAARRLGPKVQHLIDQIRPAIEEGARKGYIAEADLPKHVEAEIARRAAKSREGQTELKRVDGTPAPANANTIEAWDTRVAHQGEDGYPMLTDADWNQYRAVRKAHGIS